jgi:hypothetical protein
MDILLGLAVSQHLNFQHDYNEIHPHIRLQQDSFIAGAYYNSEERISPYAGIRLELEDHGIELGAVGGYDALGTVIPYVRYTYDLNSNVLLFAAPSGERVDGEINYGVVLGAEVLKF